MRCRMIFNIYYNNSKIDEIIKINYEMKLVAPNPRIVCVKYESF